MINIKIFLLRYRNSLAIIFYSFLTREQFKQASKSYRIPHVCIWITNNIAHISCVYMFKCRWNILFIFTHSLTMHKNEIFTERFWFVISLFKSVEIIRVICVDFKVFFKFDIFMHVRTCVFEKRSEKGRIWKMTT